MPRPDAVYVQIEPAGELRRATARGGSEWSIDRVLVAYDEDDVAGVLSVEAPDTHLARIALRWDEGVPEESRVLGDAWERTYGDVTWMGLVPDRILPWYWLAHDARSGLVYGAGVRVGPAAWCSWTVDVDGVTLWADVRAGQFPVELGDRRLEVARLVRLESAERPFAAQTELVRALATKPIAVGPIVGANNWYHAHGHNFDADAVVADARVIARLAGDHAVRPFSVIDAGWAVGRSTDGGPWDRGKDSFADMASVSERIRSEGARPGLWFRPLLSRAPSAYTHDVPLDGAWPLDPSRTETLDQIAADITRFRDWGFELIKHDFSTFDILGDFAPRLGPSMGSAPWRFFDSSRTTAEVITALYRTIALAAGDAVIIGCNTVGHLAAGLVAVQRTGDDTSGRQWERTRRMGVNSLATRLPQHGSFFTLDADCVPATPQTPWRLNRQFLDLVAKSGTALFVSIDPAELRPDVDRDLAAGVRMALDGGVPGGVEPLDAEFSSTPRRWRVSGQEVQYDWTDGPGAASYLHQV